MEENLRRRGAKLGEGDADSAAGQLRLDEGAGNADVNMFGRLLAESRLQILWEEIGNGLERQRYAIFR
jgi:hypothetical protein